MEETVSFCGRVLTAGELNLVRQIIADFPRLSQGEFSRAELALSGLLRRVPSGAKTKKPQRLRRPACSEAV